MATMKQKAADAGHKIAEAATKVGHKVSEGAEKAADWVKEKAHEVGHRASEGSQQSSGIREHMAVITSCGCHLGKVDHVQGDTIKLTKNDPAAGGRHHFIPLSWVERVDDSVHLNKNSEEAKRDWKPE